MVVLNGVMAFKIFHFYSPAAEATGLGVVCFVVINPRVLSANRVDFGFFCLINFPILLHLTLQASCVFGDALLDYPEHKFIRPHYFYDSLVCGRNVWCDIFIILTLFFAYQRDGVQCGRFRSDTNLFFYFSLRYNI